MDESTPVPLKDKLLHTAVSFANAQSWSSQIVSPFKLMPKIFAPRYRYGANISPELAEQILKDVPTLESKGWTDYWKKIGQSFEEKEDLRAACMSYVIGCFPTERVPWKDELNHLKRQSFLKWCQKNNQKVEERRLDTPDGKVRFDVFAPPKLNGKVPFVIFLNGLEGAAEEFAFPFANYLDEGIGFAAVSIPGSADYDRPMCVDSEKILLRVIDDVATLPWVDTEKIGMVGFSFGAYWTLLCAKTHPKISFSLLNGIPLRHSFGLRAAWGLNPIISNALLKMFGIEYPLQMLKISQKLIRKGEQILTAPSGPLLAINGDSDTIVDSRDTEIVGSQPGHKLLWLKRDDHCGLYHYDRMLQVIVGWLKRCLRPVNSQ